MAILIRPAARIKKVKAGNAEEVLYKLQSFLDDNMEEPVEILCGFWEDQRNAITYQELREAVKAGALNETLFQMWSQDYSVLVRGRLSGLWQNAMKAGSVSQPVIQGRNFEFNMQIPGIMNWINRRGAEFVASVSLEQKQAIQALLVKKMTERHTVDELARLIRPCIGLTKGQAQANVKYYDNIVATLRKEHPRMKMESIQRKAQDAALKYAERQHRQRAMTIAQTESAYAYNRGADEGIRQAQRQGLMGEVIKRWCTSGDHNVCATCQGLEGVEVGMDKGFQFKGRQLFAGQNLLPPAHPRCACAVEYIEMPHENISPITREAQSYNHLNAGDIDQQEENVQHDALKYLEALDNVSESMVKSTLEKYELDIVNSTIENAIVITKSGLVFQCFGNKETVYPDVDLGAELKGASVTHNHPDDSHNEYSFSSADINLFIENGLKILRGIDKMYIYELTRDLNNLDEHIPLPDLTEYDGRHEHVIEIARNLGIGYRRWKR